jgi:tetratricopeptide (TPR) repeat protein
MGSAIENDPENVMSWIRRARLYLKLGEVEKARKDESFVANKLHGTTARCYLAIYYLSNRDQAAYAEIRRELLDRPWSGGSDSSSISTILYAIALGGNTLPNYDKPIEVARKRLEASSGRDSWSQLLLGALLFRSGEKNLDEAIRLLTSSADAVRPNETALLQHYFLAMCHQRLGHREEFQHFLDKANAAADEFDGVLGVFNQMAMEALRWEANELARDSEKRRDGSR